MTSSHHHIAAKAALALVVVAAVSFGMVADALAASVNELQTQLERIRSEFSAAGKKYDEAYWQLDETEVRISETDAAIVQTEEDLVHARTVLAARLERMYRSDPVDYLSVLFGAVSYQEMMTRLEFVRRIGVADAEAIGEVEQLQTRLREEREALETQRAEREAAVGELQRRRDALQREMSAKQQEYERAQAALERARAQEAAAAARRAAPSASAVAGPNGMVFPVQGPNYYSDTWGASRSGGRRSHKGTDIMAPRGTPCVAVLAGTVTSKTNSLGGKTIWLTADNGWRFYYAHLDSWAVTSGRVSAGQVIGYVGSTGNASASSPHLHFEIHPSGSGAVNPYPYLRRMQ